MKRLTLSFAILLLCNVAGCGGRGDSKPQPQPTVDATVQADNFLTFLNHETEVNSQAYAEKYYATVDPNNERTTLADWKKTTSFDASAATHATFRDAKDLGYGRDMYAWQDAGGNAYIYVDNYLVELDPGDATSYGPLNLSAAIAQDHRYQIGTNVIEFSDDPSNAGKKIAKFFTFAPPNKSGVQQRIISANLDGRGVKFMPTMCLSCHGGEMYPLSGDSFNAVSLKSPKLHIIEEHSLEFSTQSGFTRADQKANIKAINKMVFDSYKIMGDRCDDPTCPEPPPPVVNPDLANWDSSFAESLVEIAYGDSNPGDDILEQNTDYQQVVPGGWKQNGTRPDGVETLYNRVVEPYCIGCHALRGTQAAASAKNNGGSPLANAVDFSSWENFHAYNDKIIDQVYLQGGMPRSLVNYSKFWNDPKDLPTLLASFLDNFNVTDANGNVVEPGRAVAVPGADRTVQSPVKLDATASRFTTGYSWKILSPSDGSATLDNTNSPAPTLTAANGDIVELELTTSNAKGNSVPVGVSITIDDSLAPVTFDDVIDVLDPRCVACHSPGSGIVVPIYYPENTSTDKTDFYRPILNLVNLKDPENSRLLIKPTSNDYHGGGLQLDLTDPTDKADYNVILNWIRNGAPSN